MADQNGTAANIQLIKTGVGKQTLTGTNTYTGGTRIDGGILTLGHATNTLADTGAVNVNGGTLDLGTNTDTVGAVTLTSGSITGTGAGAHRHRQRLRCPQRHGQRQTRRLGWLDQDHCSAL